MFHELQHARVAGPVHYAAGDSEQTLPQGPCLMEHVDGLRVDIIWGEHGEHCAEVSIAEIRRAADEGAFVLLA